MPYRDYDYYLRFTEMCPNQEKNKSDDHLVPGNEKGIGEIRPAHDDLVEEDNGERDDKVKGNDGGNER